MTDNCESAAVAAPIIRGETETLVAGCGTPGGWWARRKARRLAERQKRPCWEWSPGLVGYRCELPYDHPGEHRKVVRTVNGLTYIETETRIWGWDRPAGPGYSGGEES